MRDCQSASHFMLLLLLLMMMLMMTDKTSCRRSWYTRVKHSPLVVWVHRGACHGTVIDRLRHPGVALPYVAFQHPDGVTLISLHILAASAHSSSSSSLPIMSSMDFLHQLVRLMIHITVISIPIPKLLPTIRNCLTISSVLYAELGQLFRHT